MDFKEQIKTAFLHKYIEELIERTVAGTKFSYHTLEINADMMYGDKGVLGYTPRKESDWRFNFLKEIKNVTVSNGTLTVYTNNYNYVVNKKADGTYEAYRLNNHYKKKLIAKRHSSHLVFSLGYTDLYIETLVWMAYSWLDGTVPVSFEGLAVNMIDGSGSSDTPNFDINNLELISVRQNLAHRYQFGSRMNTGVAGFKEKYSNKLEY